MVKILDCTIRDGGYYNNWNFDLKTAKRLLSGLNSAGVDVVELGYKSGDYTNKFGVFKYCPEDVLTFVKTYSNLQFAFMIDAVEFIGANNEILIDKLDAIIPKADNSVFSIVRIASHKHHAAPSVELVKYLKNAGYFVCYNQMGCSLIEDEDLIDIIKLFNNVDLDVFYIADSFGSFYPTDVIRYADLLKSNSNCLTGIHLHNNQGLAYINGITALENGFDYIDATVTGMGRGAGNLVLEHFLLGLQIKKQQNQYNPLVLMEIIDEYFKPLQKTHEWGLNYDYMLSGLENIHPSFCQKMKESQRFSSTQLIETLNAIPSEKRSKFNFETLNEAANNVFNKVNQSEQSIKDSYSPKEAPCAIVVAKGPNAKNIEAYLPLLKSKMSAQYFDCNNTDYSVEIADKNIVILNQHKLNNFKKKSDYQQVITDNNNEANEIEDLVSFECSIGIFEVNNSQITIPDYDAGMYAIALALLSNPQKLLLAGFDGFEDESKNSVINDFFKALRCYCDSNDVELTSLTPTKYKHLEDTSIFSLI